MPSPLRTKTCEWCGDPWRTRKPSARTCSPRCRALLRETETPSPGKPAREYPPEVVGLARRLYVDQGMTVVEVQRHIPSGYKAQLIIERYIDARHPLGKRDQRGERNSTWRGDQVLYDGAHARIYREMGRAGDHLCADCSSRANDWSYEGKCPDELIGRNGCPYCTHPEHYKPRCRRCHRKHDRKEVMPNV